MIMQISPASIHSHQLRDPLLDDHMLIMWLVTRQFATSETPVILNHDFKTVFGSLF